jgi:hypothetical protein
MTKPKLEATCELVLINSLESVDHKRSEVVRKAIKDALTRAYPDHRVAGVWVGQSLGMDADDKAVRGALKRERQERVKEVNHLLERNEVYRKALADLLNAVRDFDFDDAAVDAAKQRAGRVLRGMDA